MTSLVAYTATNACPNGETLVGMPRAAVIIAVAICIAAVAIAWLRWG